MRDETIDQKRARESREFLERNAHIIRAAFWQQKAQNDLDAHRRSHGYD